MENHTPFPMVQEIHTETSSLRTIKNYAQKPQQNCTLMNSASALPAVYTRTHSVAGLIPKFNIPVLDLASFTVFSISLGDKSCTCSVSNPPLLFLSIQNLVIQHIVFIVQRGRVAQILAFHLFLTLLFSDQSYIKYHSKITVCKIM